MRVLLNFILCLVSIGCNSPEKQIIGKWKSESYVDANGEKFEFGHSIEFKQDGTVIFSENGLSDHQNGKMTFQWKGDSIRFMKTIPALDSEITEQETMKFEFKDDVLLLTNNRNGISKFTRKE